MSHIYYEALEYFMYFLWNNSNTETCPSWNYEPFVISNKCRGAKKSQLTRSLAILGQAITAKLAILVVMAWLIMARDMVTSDFFAELQLDDPMNYFHYQDLHQLVIGVFSHSSTYSSGDLKTLREGFNSIAENQEPLKTTNYINSRSLSVM